MIETFNTLLKALPFKAYVVGGAIRNYLLGLHPADLDLATALSPAAMSEAFRACDISHKIVSERYGVVEAYIDNFDDAVEITTFRSDFNTDGRQCQVAPVATIGEDLARRDFTVNALAYGIDEGIIDVFGGKQDIKDRILRFVGDPVLRLKEDILRAIRAMRFAGEYGLLIDEGTNRALATSGIESHVAKATNNFTSDILTIERVVQEFDKAFQGIHPDHVLGIMWRYGVIQAMIPELVGADTMMQPRAHHPEGTVWTHIKEVVHNIAPQYRWEAFLHDVGKPACAEQIGDSGEFTFHGHEAEGAKLVAEVIGSRLKFSGERTKSCAVAAAAHMRPWQAKTPKAVRRFHAKYGDHMDMLEKLHIADTMGRMGPSLYAFVLPGGKNSITPVISGRDLLFHNIKPGPEMGARLAAALNHQIDKGEMNFDVLLQVALNHEPAC